MRNLLAAVGRAAELGAAQIVLPGRAAELGDVSEAVGRTPAGRTPRARDGGQHPCFPEAAARPGKSCFPEPEAARRRCFPGPARG